MKIPPAPESTRGWVSIGSLVTMFALTLKELLLDPCTEKIYIGGADVEAVLRFKNPNRASRLLLPKPSSLLHSSRQ
jgi:hypothetical protein